jgi:thioesterase domain-containing protein
VAYEIATHLEQDGEEVALLAMMDCSARDLGVSFRQRLYWIRDGFRRHPRLALNRMRSIVQRKLSPAKDLTANNGLPANQFAAHGRAVSRHKAQRFQGTIDLFRSEELLSRLPHAPKLGWDALARTVRVHPVPCKHNALLSDQASVHLVVKVMKEFLACRST